MPSEEFTEEFSVILLCFTKIQNFDNAVDKFSTQFFEMNNILLKTLCWNPFKNGTAKLLSGFVVVQTLSISSVFFMFYIFILDYYKMILLKEKKMINSAMSMAENLDTAIKELEKHFSSDSHFPTLEEQLKIGSK